jgi:ABC-type branched-subunit amino acid transport system substrate-binding protein
VSALGSRTTHLRRLLWIGLSTGTLGCNAISGIDDFKLASEVKPVAVGCKTQRDCSDAAAKAGSSAYPATFCLQPAQRCVSLTSANCSTVTGPVAADDAVLLGSLFSISGAQATVNEARQKSAVLAVEEINAAGGLPLHGAAGQPLLLVSCDESTDLMRAGKHLVNDLHVSAIVGPNTSQDVLDLATGLTIAAGTLIVSPTAVAGSIADLSDDDLTWQMAPTDIQRGPLMIHEINTLEQDLRAASGADLKLGIVFRNDALGTGTRASLESLTWAGKPLSDPSNLGQHVRIDAYDPAHGDQNDLVQSLLGFGPDVLVLVGTGEAISSILSPLETAWSSRAQANATRPQYVLTDSSKVAELLSAVVARPDLRDRVRGTGVTASAAAAAVDESFQIDYQLRYPDDDSASSSGLGTSYDATYALAYALVASRSDAISGVAIARGLRQLSGGDDVPLRPTSILSAFSKLTQDQPIAAIGTLAPLAWDERGAVAAGTIEIWCVEFANGVAGYTSSGLSAAIPAQILIGQNHACSAHPPETPTSVGAGTSDAMPAADGGKAPQAVAAMPAAPAALPAAGSGPSAGASAPPSPAMPDMPPPSQADAGSAPPPPAAEPSDAGIPCGSHACQPEAGEYCCIGTVRGSIGSALPSDFSCQTGDKSCDASLRCSSDRQCDPGSVCCLSGDGKASCLAADSCRTGHLECDSASACASGEVCCMRGASDNGSVCAVQCLPFLSGGPLLCDDPISCVTMTGQLSCVSSSTLPNLKICQ